MVKAKEAAERELGKAGRVLLRPSGTEPVLRVMVEGEDGVKVEALAAMLAERRALSCSVVVVGRQSFGRRPRSKWAAQAEHCLLFGKCDVGSHAPHKTIHAHTPLLFSKQSGNQDPAEITKMPVRFCSII